MKSVENNVRDARLLDEQNILVLMVEMVFKEKLKLEIRALDSLSVIQRTIKLPGIENALMHVSPGGFVALTCGKSAK